MEHVRDRGPAAQNLTLLTVSQKCLPWISAMMSSRTVGLREPSGAAKVSAPQGEPMNNAWVQHAMSNRHTKWELRRVTPRAYSSCGYSEYRGVDARGDGRTPMHLGEVRELAKRLGVPEGHEDDAVVGERRERRDHSRLLAASGGCG